ncbi:MAG: hypothetical protein E6J34_11535 [Chloroflexi bacterium]|nr:MAG: hypothetical protein E6J34_11535 [Chloroflexota bacterium]
MPDDKGSNHIPQLEHAITTVLACLSMVKYNVVLGEEQKKELVADIETMLRFLRSNLVSHAMTPETPRTGQSPRPAGPSTSTAQPDEQILKSEQRQMQTLYRIYHAYVIMEQGNTLGTLLTRFQEVMTVIDDVQTLLEHSRGSYDVYQHHTSMEDQLHRVRGFIADLYYTFSELMRSLSDALHEREVYLNTEELSSLPKPPAEGYALSVQYDKQGLAALTQTYEEHERLNAGKATLSRHIGDAIAFLEFLDEALPAAMHKRDEIVAQMEKISHLLHDVAHLLANYESAATLLLCK